MTAKRTPPLDLARDARKAIVACTSITCANYATLEEAQDAKEAVARIMGVLNSVVLHFELRVCLVCQKRIVKHRLLCQVCAGKYFWANATPEYREAHRLRHLKPPPPPPAKRCHVNTVACNAPVQMHRCGGSYPLWDAAWFKDGVWVRRPGHTRCSYPTHRCDVPVVWVHAGKLYVQYADRISGR